ncbi:MAG: hypothetical protein KJ808_04070 [Acidobacteria bacterium]|nr:hypothetical protein [Acidobacteriota bacterium]MBU4306693.1 hypothetical protein [Acidobacteriota bacterium]MCG2810126.1 hypothetical protein [Candidatus Aminicenantes bacterium]
MALTGAIVEILGPLALLLTWLLGDGGLFLLLAMAAAMAAGEYFYRFSADRFPLPYLGLALSPLLLLNYSSVGDFRIRLACFFMLIYILSLARRHHAFRVKIPMPIARPWRVWFISFLVFALAAVVFYAQGIHLSGDEPHYVMIAQSLVEDGDFDLKNNLENKTYFTYLPVEIRFHGSIHSGKYHSFHMPGIAFLLLPFFYLFKLLGGLLPGSLYFRLVAALINSIFALGLFLAIQNAMPKKDNDRYFIFFLVTFPLVFHAVHLFPELPAAALMIFAYIFGRDKQRFFLAGLLLACIPWLHLKYSIPALILALFLMARIRHEIPKNGSRLKQLTLLLTAPAISMALLALYSKFLYGSFNPSAISPEKIFFAMPIKFRIETLLSFFLDQRDGLLIYAPIFILVFLVFKKEIRTGIRDFSLLLSVFIAYILFHAITTVRGGYSPAARPTLFVMWIMAVFLVAWRQYAQPGISRAIFRLLAGMTVFSTVWLFYYPLFLYQPVTRAVSQRASSWLWFLSSEVIDLSAFFPSFLKKDNSSYLSNWVWLGSLLCILVIYYAIRTKNTIVKAARFLYPLAGTALLAMVCFIPHVQLRTRYTAAGLSFYSNSRNFSYHKEASAFRILAGRDYDLFFDLKGSATDRLDLRLLNDKRITLQVKNGRQTLLADNRAPENRLTLRLSTLNAFHLGKRSLVHLGLESKSGKGNTFFWLEFH